MSLLAFFQSFLLGVIQGITEWLPISSTGHMILADEFIKLQASDAFKSMFFVVIQLGSILAVVFLYFKKLNPLYFTRVSGKQTLALKKDTLSLWAKVLVAVIPAGIIGVLFEEQIDAFFYNSYVVAAALIVYGVLFIVIENRHKRPRINTFDSLSYKTALLIGVFQVLALIPGTSRSGSTILGAVILGTSRTVAAEFSFFLAVPVMFGASFLKLIHYGFAFEGSELAILATGFLTAFVVSIFAIKFLMGYIKKHDFKVFGYYRIVLGVIVFLYFFIR